jgi:hypothetical protein
MSYVDIVARYLQLTLHEIKKDDANLYVKIISKIDWHFNLRKAWR